MLPGQDEAERLGDMAETLNKGKSNKKLMQRLGQDEMENFVGSKQQELKVLIAYIFSSLVHVAGRLRRRRCRCIESC